MELAGKRRIPQATESQLGMWLRLGPLGTLCAPAYRRPDTMWSRDEIQSAAHARNSAMAVI
jgi:hypothetical protein